MRRFLRPQRFSSAGVFYCLSPMSPAAWFVLAHPVYTFKEMH
ncbi:hypothetical protein BN137_2393 [Cronobacter condimenti 1330]|uniref:Uncharacterized protein n=1 Tax=Cronobacter condimenti 1330 TaxID=1073999 RepID=K8AFK3_9ENTR|nr:hypothetical protein BN137_2393 [Cronobacter condimenti 1330]